MFLERRTKCYLPWVTVWKDVSGHKACQDNFGGLHKDWKKHHLSCSLLSTASCRTVSTPTVLGEPGCSLQKRVWEQTVIHSLKSIQGTREHNGDLTYLTALKSGRVGRLSQSYLLENIFYIFFPTLNGQAIG